MRTTVRAAVLCGLMTACGAAPGTDDGAARDVSTHADASVGSDSLADVPSEGAALEAAPDAPLDAPADVRGDAVAGETDAPVCPAPPADLLDARLVGPGNPLIQRQLSRQIVAIALPDLEPHGSGQITFGETPAASTPQPVTLELSISRCRGVIDTDLTNFCNLRSTNGNYNSITYLARPYMTIVDAASASARGYCWAPASAGPWYLNARWTYDACGFGSSTCGFAIQYNLGPF